MRDVEAARVFVELRNANRLDEKRLRGVPVLLEVKCKARHHVLGVVYLTAAGPLWTSHRNVDSVGPPDEPDGPLVRARGGWNPMADLLVDDADSDVAYPAGEIQLRCRCGATSLSRRALRSAVDERQPTILA